MKSLSNSRKGISIALLSSLFLFTGCSQKNVNNDYTKFYKDTHNSKINNSPQMHKYTMRPYSVFGIKYYPFIANVGDEFEGIASWYGPDFHSKKTSNGEVYNMYDMTAAHKTLPMNTVVRVDNLDNGRSVTVRINDRGPFVRGRIIDLSNKAAHEIDMVRRGTANVKVTVLGYNGEIENRNAPYAAVSNNIVGEPIKKESIDALEPMDIKEDKITSTNIALSAPLEKSSVVTPVVTPKTTVSKPTMIMDSPKAKTVPVAIGNYSIQVGAFSKIEGAIKTANDYQRRFGANKVTYEKVSSLYKVFIKGFNSYEDAQRFKNMNDLGNALIIK